MAGEDEDQGSIYDELPPAEEPPAELDPVEEAFGRGGKKRRKRQARANPGETIGHLNLTPMMDIMTMLLVFLVMSFATEPSNINVSLALRPPRSTTKVELEPATRVTITKEMILVDDKNVVSLEAVRRDAVTRVSIPEVRDALFERKDQLEAIADRGGEPFDKALLVVADETTPYAIIASVLITAGEAKFADYKLVLMQKAGQDTP